MELTSDIFKRSVYNNRFYSEQYIDKNDIMDTTVNNNLTASDEEIQIDPNQVDVYANPSVDILNGSDLRYITLEDPLAYQKNVYYVYDYDSHTLEKEAHAYKIMCNVTAVVVIFIFFIMVLYLFEDVTNSILLHMSRAQSSI